MSSRYINSIRECLLKLRPHLDVDSNTLIDKNTGVRSVIFPAGLLVYIYIYIYLNKITIAD